MSRPKDQDQDEPATPPGVQTRTITWTHQLTVREVRGWFNALPDDAVLSMWVDKTHSEMGIGATWEVP